MRIVKIGMLFATAIALSALFAGAASANSWDPHPQTPLLNKVYKCSYEFIGGPHKGQKGEADLTYTEISCQKLADGNTLCRPVRTRNVYSDPNVQPLEELVTMTKPLSCGTECSVWEYTVNQPFNAQCKSFRVERLPLPGGAHARYILSFRDCSNFVVQTCTHAE